MTPDIIIVDIIADMYGFISNEQIERLRIVLVNTLKDYELTQKETALVPYDDINTRMLTKFIAWKGTEGKSKRTLTSYMFVIRKMLDTVQKPVNEIEEDDILIYLYNMKKNGASSSYLKTTRNYLSSFFSWLSQKKQITTNPIEGIDPIKVEKKVRKAFTDVEMENMRRSIDNQRDIAIFEFLYSTGCRVSELCQINVSDIDFVRHNVKIQGKGAKERVVPFNDVAAFHVQKYITERGFESDILFTHNRGNHDRLNPAGIQSILKNIGKKAGVEDVHPHRLRRTLATNLIRKGVKFEEVSKILGHVKLDTTMTYYAIDQEVIKNDYERVMNG